MPSPYQVPNRPVGTATRAIATLLENFDYITGGLDEIWNRKIPDSSFENNVISGTRLKSESIPLSKLESKIDANNLELGSYFSSGDSETHLSNTVTAIQQAGVSPGIYLALATIIAKDSSTAVPVLRGLKFDTTGGAASVANTDPTNGSGAISPAAASFPSLTVMGLIIVTSTTTVRLRGNVIAAPAPRAHLALFGVKNP